MEIKSLTIVTVMMLLAAKTYLTDGQAYQTAPPITNSPELLPLGDTTPRQRSPSPTKAAPPATAAPQLTTRRPPKQRTTTRRRQAKKDDTVSNQSSSDTTVLVAVITTVGVLLIAATAAVSVFIYKHKTESRRRRSKVSADATALKELTEGKPKSYAALRQSHPNPYTSPANHSDNESIYEVIVDADNSSKTFDNKRTGPLPARPTSLNQEDGYITVNDKSTTPVRNDEYYSYVTVDSVQRRENNERLDVEGGNRISDVSYFG